MTLHQILLTAHILTAILTIGWLATNSMVMPGIIRRGPESAGFVRAAGEISKKVGPMSGLVFLLGVWLVLRKADDGNDFDQGWVSASMLMYIVTAVIGAVFIGGAERRAAEKLAAGQRADEEARTISILGGISTLLLVLIVYLMVAKQAAF